MTGADRVATKRASASSRRRDTLLGELAQIEERLRRQARRVTEGRRRRKPHSSRSSNRSTASSTRHSPGAAGQAAEGVACVTVTIDFDELRPKTSPVISAAAARCPRFPFGQRAARFSACSARTAPANPRCSRCSRRCCGQAPASIRYGSHAARTAGAALARRDRHAGARSVPVSGADRAREPRVLRGSLRDRRTATRPPPMRRSRGLARRPRRRSGLAASRAACGSASRWSAR